MNHDIARAAGLEAEPPNDDCPPVDGARLADHLKSGLSLNGLEVYASINCRLLGKAASMIAHTSCRHALTAIALAVLALSMTACAGEDDTKVAPTDVPTSSATGGTSEPTTSPTLTPSPTPTTDPDAWRTKFSPSQLDAYDTALKRWESYESRSEPIWARGKATPSAEKLFKEFFPHPAWKDYWERLQGYEQINVIVSGTPTVYWSQAKSVSASGSSVQVQQCVDYTPVQRTQDGGEISRPEPTPQLRTIFLSRPKAYNWLIYGVKELVNGKPQPCAS